jgi:hypothetical protein
MFKFINVYRGALNLMIVLNALYSLFMKHLYILSSGAGVPPQPILLPPAAFWPLALKHPIKNFTPSAGRLKVQLFYTCLPAYNSKNMNLPELT